MLDISRFWTRDEEDPPGHSAPAADVGSAAESEGASDSKSRENSLKDGLRSKVLFPEAMARRIAAELPVLTRIHSPRNEHEAWLVSEIARTKVQYQRCGELLDRDAVRIHERIVGDEWEEDRIDAAARLAARIRKDAYRNARLAESSLQGAELFLYHWGCLADSVASTGTWTDVQRERAFDLLGVPEEHRAGSLKVPAVNDTKGLLKLVARETTRLKERLPALRIKDQLLRERAADGETLPPDATTRRRRSDESRAYTRMKWATETLERLKAGAPPSTLIDPETKRPIEPGPAFVTVTKPAAEPAPAAPADPAPAPAGRPLDPRDVPLPEDCPDDIREALAVARATFFQMKEAGTLPKPPQRGASASPAPPAA
jgi:hypothetical protein